MTITDLKEKGLLLFEAISGSRAYGTNKETSDTDYRGVYILPIDNILGFDYIEQVSDATNDSVYYEIGRFLDLVQQQNPNILELLNMPEENILYKHPLFDLILANKERFLSKVCRDSFGGYAVAQIKKARGMNKKIVTPMEKERKTILDFCFVPYNQGSLPMTDFLRMNRIDIRQCGIVAIDHMKNTYHLFADLAYNEDQYFQAANAYRKTQDTPYCFSKAVMDKLHDDVYQKVLSLEKLDSIFNGFIDKDGVQLRLSSVPKEMEPVVTFYCNIEGFSTYCKQYREYWDWVEKRNADRYNTNQEHGKGYDSKNMMHCVRLVRMACEIAEQHMVIVRRPDAAELLKIRNGEMEYEDLLAEAEQKIKQLDELYANCSLPASIDKKFVNELLIVFRREFYNLYES